MQKCSAWYNRYMEYAKSYDFSQVGVGTLLLDVLKKVNQRFRLGEEGIAGFPLNIESDSQLQNATITLSGFEPEFIDLNDFSSESEPRDLRAIIEDLEREVGNALNILRARRDSSH